MAYDSFKCRTWMVLVVFLVTVFISWIQRLNCNSYINSNIVTLAMQDVRDGNVGLGRYSMHFRPCRYFFFFWYAHLKLEELFLIDHFS